MTTGLLFDLPGHSVDEQTAALLQSVSGSPANDVDRRRVVAAIVRDARDHAGKIDQNRVRTRLVGTDGALTVKPQVIGSVFRMLAASRHLQPIGHLTSTDRHGRNTGKPLRAWRLVINPTHGDQS